MMQLGRQQINSIWVEAGPGLAGALLQAGLVDELIVYVAPKLLGTQARGLCELPGLRSSPTRRNLPSAKYDMSARMFACIW